MAVVSVAPEALSVVGTDSVYSGCSSQIYMAVVTETLSIRWNASGCLVQRLKRKPYPAVEPNPPRHFVAAAEA